MNLIVAFASSAAARMTMVLIPEGHSVVAGDDVNVDVLGCSCCAAVA